MLKSTGLEISKFPLISARRCICMVCERSVTRLSGTWCGNDLKRLSQHRRRSICFGVWRRRHNYTCWRGEECNSLASQRTDDAIITSLWRRNDVATSFRRHNDVIIALCAHWDMEYLNEILVKWFSSLIDWWGIDCEISHRWMPLDLTDDKSTLVQVMASGNKPLPDRILTQIYVAIWRH